MMLSQDCSNQIETRRRVGASDRNASGTCKVVRVIALTTLFLLALGPRYLVASDQGTTSHHVGMDPSNLSNLTTDPTGSISGGQFESVQPRNLFKVSLNSHEEAIRLRATRVEAILRLGNEYLVLADDLGAQELVLNQLDHELVTEGVAKNQLALDRRRDDLNIDRYATIFEKDGIRLFQVDPVEMERVGEPLDLLPIHNKYLKIIYKEAPAVTDEGLRRSPALNLEIEDLVDYVKQDSVEAYLYRLQAFNERVSGRDSIYAARDWIAEKFHQYGYASVVLDHFTATSRYDGIEVDGYNVVATKLGSKFPDKHIIVGAHYDGVPGSPAVDDNGSGTVGVMEMARALTHVQTDMTIIFVAFDMEEHGLYGSWHYADNAAARGDNIVMMFNMDMIADIENDAEASMISGPNTLFVQTWIDLADTLVGITGYLAGYGSGSDHDPFNQNGFDIAFASEFIFSDTWHQPNDSTTHINFDYCTRMIKASLATVYTVSNSGDLDRDGILDDDDNCILVANPLQANADGDSYGDVCDNCPTVTSDIQADSDNDGLGEPCDNCPTTFNPTQDDMDLDDVGDLCDNCYDTPNPSQDDLDFDGIGDLCDPVRIGNLVENGPPCLETEVILIGNSLTGTVDISEVLSDPIDAIVFEILAADCGNEDEFEFFLNNVSLGTVLSDPTTGCNCGPPLQSFAVTDTELLRRLWNVGGHNTFRFIKRGDGNAFSWVQARIDAGASSNYVCIYDFDGGTCSSLSLCGSGYFYDGFDVTSSFADAWTELTPVSSTPFSGSILPETIDISSILDQDLALCISVQEELDAPAVIDTLRFVVMNTACSSPDTYEFYLNGVSMGTCIGDPGISCNCEGVTTVFDITDPGLLSAWVAGVNEFRFVKAGTGTFVAWVQVEVLFAGGSDIRCLFHGGDGQCGDAVGCDDYVTTSMDFTETRDFSKVEAVSHACKVFTKQGEDLLTINGHCPETGRPAAVCHDVTVEADSNCLAEASVDGGSYDPDGDPITVIQDPVGPFNLGESVVSLYVTDAGGLADTCQSIVTVVDQTEPVLSLPGSIQRDVDPGQCSAVVTFEMTASDNCPGVIVTSTPPSGSAFPVGITQVSCTAEDASGNVSVGGFFVVVSDTVPPVCQVPNDTTVTLCEPSEIHLPVDCIDYCDLFPQMEVVDGPGEIVGKSWRYVAEHDESFRVTVRCMDFSDNFCEASFIVRIRLNEPPVVTYPEYTGVHWGDFLNVSPTIENEENVDLRFSLSSGTDASIDSVSGVVSWLTGAGDVGIHEFIVIASDVCGETVTCEFAVCVENTPPTFDCPENVLLCFGQVLDVDVIATDIDDGPYPLAYSLVSFSGPGIPVVNPANGHIQWMTEETPDFTGSFELCVAVSDSGNVSEGCTNRSADTCCFTINVAPSRIVIEEQTGDGPGVLQGQPTTVEISMLSSDYNSYPLAGFSFLIAYDATALNFIEALEGELFTDCAWEYFTYRFGPDGNCGNACPSGLLRVVALAETNNGAAHPVCFGNSGSETDATQLAQLVFLVSNDRTLECQYLPIRFYWLECQDNGVSTVTGDTLLISNRVYEVASGTPVEIQDPTRDFPTYQGATFGCDTYTDKGEPLRCLDLWNGGIKVICGDSIDAVGDINVNGIAYEVADAVMFTRYFIEGLPAFEAHADASIAASDANRDGVPLTVADLVYLIRVVVGDADPYPRQESLTLNCSIFDGIVSIDAEMGAVYMVVDGNSTPTLLADGMEMTYRFDRENNVTRILVYSLERDNTFVGEFLAGIYGRVVSTEFSTYYGTSVSAALIPAEFELSQNYPNPFNPVTEIGFSLPLASHATLEICNIMGQKVATLIDAQLEPGRHTVTWNGEKSASGVYFYRLKAGQFVSTKKMILLK